MTTDKQDCIVVLSGGQDSTTCLFWAKEHFAKIHAVTFNYGQRHDRELIAAQKIGEMGGVDSHEFINVPNVLKGTSPLVSPEFPEQYKDWQALPGGLEKTFVPCRNILFLTLAANRAYCENAPNIVTGVAQEDFGGYPDCRDRFIFAMEGALRRGLTLSDMEPFSNLRIHTPLMHVTKAETVLMAAEMRGCFNALAYSHTAYGNEYPPTGKDHATLLREKGFELSGFPDPLVMRAVGEGLMEMPSTDNYSSEAINKFNDIMSWGDDV